MARGLLIAAPASGSGKTVVTLALLRHFRRSGLSVASVKVGPDYIDPAFHAVASGRPCLNLDSWAMRAETLAALVAEAEGGAELVLGEGVMGLFDGAHTGARAGAPGAPAEGAGSTAELALLTGWPVVLVVDVRGMAASAAALVKGFIEYRPEVPIAGAIFNRVGGEGHAGLLRAACAPLGLPVLGCIPRSAELTLPDRHLGLVQAVEHADLENFLERAAGVVARHVDTEALCNLAAGGRLAARRERNAASPPLPPLGQRIAVARDTAFAFAYPHVLEGWRRAGAELSEFSPLADEAPDPEADAVYLPGGYPELHAGRLAANRVFRGGLRSAAERGAAIYGECGGYMVLGEGLIDAEGACHAMTGLLPLETSFAERRLHLGYREAALSAPSALGEAGATFRGHEFHYATVLREDGDAPLFQCRAADRRNLGAAGRRRGAAMGSFLHLIDAAA
jgi:cobyrinic acid a,c-diamide synthase